MRAPQRVTQRRCESLPTNFFPRRRHSVLWRDFPEETRETSSESGSRQVLFISQRRDTLRPWSTTLATAETSFVARARARMKDVGREERRAESERDAVWCLRMCCMCVRAHRRTEPIRPIGRDGEKRGEVNKVPDMVSRDRRECHFTYTRVRVHTHAPSYAAHN